MPDLIHYAIPGFVLLLTAEVIFSAWDKRGLYETKDAASSIAMGLGNVFIGLLTKGVIYLIYTLVYQFRIFTSTPASGGYGSYVSLQTISPITGSTGSAIISGSSGPPM